MKKKIYQNEYTFLLYFFLGFSHPIKQAGPYLIGPRLGSSPVSSITQCLARKSGSDQFYTLKVEIDK